MAQTSLFNSANQSRLLGLLSDLQFVDLEVSHERYGERLGKLIEFSDSFALSDAHYYISKMKASDIDTDDSVQVRAEEIKQEFFRVRALIVKTIAKSFSPDPRTRFKAPKPREDDGIEEALKYEPYRRFYAIQQREMDVQVQSLRGFVRETISEISLPLKKLAALDKALGDSLQVHASKQLATIPRILEAYFKRCYEQGEAQNRPIIEWTASDGWLTNFMGSMQTLLIAESDLRLKPVQGMIEALSKEVVKHND